MLVRDLRDIKVFGNRHAAFCDNVVDHLFLTVSLDLLSHELFDRHFTAVRIIRVLGRRRYQNMTYIVGLGRIAARVFRVIFLLELDDMVPVVGFDNLRGDLAGLKSQRSILKGFHHLSLSNIFIQPALRLAFRILISGIFAVLIGKRCKILIVFCPVQYVFRPSLFIFWIEVRMFGDIFRNIIVRGLYFIGQALAVKPHQKLRLL